MLCKLNCELPHFCLIIICARLAVCLNDQATIGNREELVVTSIEHDPHFFLEQQFPNYKAYTIGNYSYVIGYSNKSLGVEVLKLDSNRNTFIYHVSFHFDGQIESPTDAVIFRFWRENAVVLAAGTTKHDMMLFKLDLDKPPNNPVYHSVVDGRILHMNQFETADKVYLVVLKYLPAQNFTALDLYEVKEFKHYIIGCSHTMVLPYYVNMAAINVYEGNVYLSLPDNSREVLHVFKFNPSIGYFDSYKTLFSGVVSRLTSFRIGFKSFLAVAGPTGAIYQFTIFGPVLVNVVGGHLDEVEVWHAIPSHSYRDDVVLLLERSLDHMTHNSLHVEVVLYDGKNFVFHDEVMCNSQGEEKRVSTCLTLLGDSFKFGTPVVIGRTLGILVSIESVSELFIIHTSLKRVESPNEKQSKMLTERMRRLQERINKQRADIEEIQERSRNSVKLDEPNKPTGTWKSDTVSSAAFQRTPNADIISDNLQATEVDILDLKNDIIKIQQAIKDVKEKMQTALHLGRYKNSFDSLILEGDLEVEGESYIKTIEIEKINDEPAVDVFEDIVRKNNISKPITGHKTFTNLSVENIEFATLNGKPYNKTVVFDKSVYFNASFTVLDDVIGKINGHNLTNEIVRVDQNHSGTLEFEHIKTHSIRAKHFPGFGIMIPDNENEYNLNEASVDVLNIPVNITVENVNGESFNDFLKSLCFINVDTYINGEVTIDGNLTVQDDVEIDTLNGLRFPEDYVVKGLEYSVITGRKMFKGDVFAREITTSGLVNGIDTANVISLTGQQTLPGTYTFNDLEISSTLDIEGDITGINSKSFAQSPTLLESKEINSSVNFYDLHVQGNVVISKNLSNVNFEEMLKDVVYTDEEEVTITASKEFAGGLAVAGGVDVASGAIGSISVSEFITANTDQVISLPRINTDVRFRKLSLQGLYDGVNVTKLDQETLKLTGEQHVQSTIVFSNDGDADDLSATELNIIGTLNGIKVSDYCFTTSKNTFAGELQFDNIEVSNLEVVGDILGTIEGFSVEEFDKRRLSYTKNQNITAHYNITNLETDNFHAITVNNESFAELFDFEYFKRAINNTLVNGGVKIKNLQVEGSIFVDTINGHNISEFLRDGLFENINNVVFHGNVSVPSLSVTEFNNLNFNEFVSNIVFKNERNPIVYGLKLFTNGFRVTEMLDTMYLNDIYVDDILTKSGTQTIEGPLNIYGNVIIEDDCEILGNLNDISMQYLYDTYQCTDHTCTINDDVVMEKLPYISRLTVDGNVNRKNLTTFLNNLVYKSSSMKIPGTITFNANVQVKQNMHISGNLNDRDFSSFVDNVAYTTSNGIIQGPLAFTQPVHIRDTLTAVDLETKYLNGIPLSSWKDDAVFINQGKIPGKIMFEHVEVAKNIKTDFINNLDMRTVIPLRTDQVINATMNFLELSPLSNVPVGNKVNGYDSLIDEYKRTLRTTNDTQEVLHNITFHGNVHVYRGLNTYGSVNGNDMKKVVRTDTDQNLTAIYEFKNATLNSDLIFVNSDSTVNNINLTLWKEQGVKSYQEQPQEIKNNWLVFGHVMFNEDVAGNGYIGDFHVADLANMTRNLQIFTSESKMALSKQYRQLCNATHRLLNKIENQIYLLKYLDYQYNSTQQPYSVELRTSIGNIHYFQHHNNELLLISERDSCSSYLFERNPQKEYQLIDQFELGRVAQVVTVYDGDLIFLVGRISKSFSCSKQGTYIWRIEENNLILLYILNHYEKLQESLIPGTFYALERGVIFEYKIVTDIETNIRIYRKWTVGEENLRFVPRGLSSGLVVTSGRKWYTLRREKVDSEDITRYDTEAIIVGKIEIISDLPLYPKSDNDESLVINVGFQDSRRTFFVVASHDDTTIRGRLDAIKIYEDVFSAKIFHKIFTYKPSSLLSLEFGNNGQSFLVFLEDNKILRIFEYKGIEGFKPRGSAYVEADRLILITNEYERYIAVVNKNKLNFIRLEMTGNRMKIEKPDCNEL